MSKRRIRKKGRTGPKLAPRASFGSHWPLLIAVFAIAVTALVTAVRGPREASRPRTAAPPSGTILAKEIRDPRVGEVERRFRCPCGQCGGKDLVECGCDAPGGAQETKAAIIAALDAGNDVESTVATIARRFPGALKATGDTARVAPLGVSSHGNVFLEVAGQIDCPCGECQLRLLDCNCEKDRGAAEVKAFIRERDRAGRTVPEIIAAFERVYGKKRG